MDQTHIFVVDDETPFSLTMGGIAKPMSTIMHSVPAELKISKYHDFQKDCYEFVLGFWFGNAGHTLAVLTTCNWLISYTNEQIGIELKHRFLQEFDHRFPDAHKMVRNVFEKRLVKVLCGHILAKDTPLSNYSLGYFSTDETLKDGEFYVSPGTAANNVAKASRKLPAVYTLVNHPCEHKKDSPENYTSLWYVIQHLNDYHKDWTREDIADWIDELHDTGQINAEFEPWNAVFEPCEEEKDLDGWQDVGYTVEDVQLKEEE